MSPESSYTSGSSYVRPSLPNLLQLLLRFSALFLHIISHPHVDSTLSLQIHGAVELKIAEPALQKLLFRLQHIPFAPIKLPSYIVSKPCFRLFSRYLILRRRTRTNLHRLSLSYLNCGCIIGINTEISTETTKNNRVMMPFQGCVC